MAATLLFMLPFRARLTWNDKLRLGDMLGLRIKRGDDWDDQLGFRLVGNIGALRLYRLPVTDWDDEAPYYELRATANQAAALREFEPDFEQCYRAILEVNGIIDERRLLSRPDQSPG